MKYCQLAGHLTKKNLTGQKPNPILNLENKFQKIDLKKYGLDTQGSFIGICPKYIYTIYCTPYHSILLNLTMITMK